jgi:hypothetical protein
MLGGEALELGIAIPQQRYVYIGVPALASPAPSSRRMPLRRLFRAFFADVLPLTDVSISF